MAGLRIRTIVESDLDAVLAINEANVPEVGPLDIDALRFLLGEASHALLVDAGDVDDGDDVRPAPIGFCLVLGPGSTYDSVNYTWFVEHRPGAMYLDRVAVDERWRGRGVGRTLYRHVERSIRAGSPASPGLGLEVNIDPPNEPSLRFHDTLGFAEVGRQMSHGVEVSLMFKPADAFTVDCPDPSLTVVSPTCPRQA